MLIGLVIDLADLRTLSQGARHDSQRMREILESPRLLVKDEWRERDESPAG
jgi:hypothetical protein